MSNREVIVQLSPRGAALVRRLIPVALHLERIALADISAGELAGIKRLLRRIFTNLGAARISSAAS
jgi:DNA-binding MarR family transcriptional regulator